MDSTTMLTHITCLKCPTSNQKVNSTQSLKHEPWTTGLQRNARNSNDPMGKGENEGIKIEK